MFTTGRIGVATAETYRGKAELILVCVKGYSVDSVADCIVRASGERTVVLPILNVYGSGPRIARACPGSRVIDGCIYIVGYIQAPGEVTQSGQVCKLVFGARPGDGVSPEELETVRRTLADAGVKAILSEDIDRDTFAKWDLSARWPEWGLSLTHRWEPYREKARNGMCSSA